MKSFAQVAKITNGIGAELSRVELTDVLERRHSERAASTCLSGAAGGMPPAAAKIAGPAATGERE